MALDDAALGEIEGLLGGPSASADAVAELRRRLRDHTVTQCDAADVDLEAPFRSWPCFSIYLVDNADHCWRLTSDASRATGLVVVARPSPP